jgi:hypothetical protein
MTPVSSNCDGGRCSSFFTPQTYLRGCTTRRDRAP